MDTPTARHSPGKHNKEQEDWDIINGELGWEGGNTSCDSWRHLFSFFQEKSSSPHQQTLKEIEDQKVARKKAQERKVRQETNKTQAASCELCSLNSQRFYFKVNKQICLISGQKRNTLLRDITWLVVRLYSTVYIVSGLTSFEILHLIPRCLGHWDRHFWWPLNQAVKL